MTFSCESAAMARASCSNRARISGSRERWAGRTFERDVAPQPGIVRPVHLSHTAGPDECLHFVLRESSARNE